MSDQRPSDVLNITASILGYHSNRRRFDVVAGAAGGVLDFSNVCNRFRCDDTPIFSSAAWTLTEATGKMRCNTLVATNEPRIYL
jgi:hypothetical protein